MATSLGILNIEIPPPSFYCSEPGDKLVNRWWDTRIWDEVLLLRFVYFYHSTLIHNRIAHRYNVIQHLYWQKRVSRVRMKETNNLSEKLHTQNASCKNSCRHERKTCEINKKQSVYLCDTGERQKKKQRKMNKSTKNLCAKPTYTNIHTTN